MCRGEFMEGLVRISQQCYTKNRNATNFQYLIDNQIKPFLEKSEIYGLRKRIRERKQVNFVLDKNKKQLIKIFN